MADNLPAKKIAEIEVTTQTLKMLMQTPTIPVRYRESKTGVNDMLAVAMWGRELGLGFFTSIYELFLVNGQASMQGKLMLALVWRAGHEVNISIDETSSTVQCYRRNQEGILEVVGDVTFTIEDAERAGLMDKGTYLKYPKSMLTWRAVSLACRIYFPDVILSIGHVPEELNIEAPMEPVPEGVVVTDNGELEMERALMAVDSVMEAEVVDE